MYKIPDCIHETGDSMGACRYPELHGHATDGEIQGTLRIEEFLRELLSQERKE